MCDHEGANNRSSKSISMTVVNDMVAFTLHGANPVHFISTAATFLKWKENKKKA